MAKKLNLELSEKALLALSGGDSSESGRSLHLEHFLNTYDSSPGTSSRSKESGQPGLEINPNDILTVGKGGLTGSKGSLGVDHDLSDRVTIRPEVGGDIRNGKIEIVPAIGVRVRLP